MAAQEVRPNPGIPFFVFFFVCFYSRSWFSSPGMCLYIYIRIEHSIMRALMNWCECECAPAGRLSSRDEPFNLVSATGHGCALTNESLKNIKR